jgi:hypothetical protein
MKLKKFGEMEPKENIELEEIAEVIGMAAAKNLKEKLQE